MKLLCILSALLITGCFAETVYDPPPNNSLANGYNNYAVGCVDFTDQLGTRTVCAPHYFSNSGEVIYWDQNLRIWIAPRGYYNKGVYFRGQHPLYHHYYRR